VNLSELKYDLYDTVLAIKRRWFRSALSSLGVAIGVASLIVMLSISEGTLEKTTQQYHQLGLNTLRIQSLGNDGAPGRGISEAEFIDIQEQLPSSAKVSAFIVQETSKAEFNGLSTAASLVYASQHWVNIEKLALEKGRFLSQSDQLSGASFCVIGYQVSQALNVKLYQSSISFNGYSCTVVGVLSKKQGAFVENKDIHFIDFNRVIILPFKLQPQVNRFSLAQLSEISIEMPPEETGNILALSRALNSTLAKRYQGLLNYQVVSPLELLNKEKDSQLSFSLIMMSISVMTLLVGGIGIMNIMLTHISEQTREIGLRLAVGASPQRIVNVFLLHALIISMLGCFLGGSLGLLMVLGFDLFLDWPIKLSVFALVIGPLFSLITGLLFGLYPALRASQMDPIIMLKEF